ncbi:MAG: gliding motility-associated C-terminal domain-containing protein [Saprospiraceae bacterium]
MNLFKILVVFLASCLFSISFDASQCQAQCNVKFTATTEAGKTNDVVTVKITVENFTDISGVQWTMRWDPTCIEYVSIGDFDLTDLNAGSFNLTKVTQGYLTTAWYNQQGTTKTNGAVIFTIKFKLLGADGKSCGVDFSSTPLQIEISDKNAQKCPNPTLVNGKVNIGTVVNPPPGANLKIASSANLIKDQEICLPVTVTGFKNITAMQFSFGWDVAKLTFTKVQKFSGFTALDLGNFNLVTTSIGKLSCVWFDPNTTGQTVADGTAIFEVCYTYKGVCPGSAAVNITNDPTATQVVSSTGTLTITKEGSVLTTPASCTSGLGVTASKITHPCPGQNNGGIEITASGGTGNYTYLWSNGATTQNLANIGAGSFNVTVKDGAGTTASLANAVVLSALTVTSQLTEPSGGNNNGSITLTVSGGNSGYKYLWSNNATTKDINNLATGTYTYTVTDAANCTIGPISVAIGNVALDITNIVATGPTCAGGQSSGIIAISTIGGKTPYTYAWTGPNNFTATTEDISGLVAGTYKVTVKDAANATKTSADIVLTGSGTPLTLSGRIKNVSLPGVNDGEITVTPIGGTPPVTYRWNTGSTSATLTGLAVGDYTVTATDSKGCSTAATTFKITSNPYECFTSIRAFTPNGDGVNELFIINCAETINNQLQIYNRWNQLVYSSSNYRNNWNGIDNKGFLLPDGTYYWILKDNSNASSLYKGYVTLIRTLN